VRQLAFGLGRRFTHRVVFTIRQTVCWFSRYVMSPIALSDARHSAEKIEQRLLAIIFGN